MKKFVSTLFDNQNLLQHQTSSTNKRHRADAIKQLGTGGSFNETAITRLVYDRVKSYAQGDAAKIDEMKAAIEKGYQETKEAWGGSLAGISEITYNDIMGALDYMKREVA
jgi:hypothetical protein